MVSLTSCRNSFSSWRQRIRSSIKARFPLPEAQLDRFMISMSIGYPQRADEREIVKKSLVKGSFVVQPILSLDDILGCRDALQQVFIHDTLIDYIVDIVDATRKHPSTVLGVSPRGSQLLARAAQVAAFVDGREFVIPEDIKFLAPYVFGHRIVPKVKSKRVSHAEIIEKIMESVPLNA